MTDSEFLNAFDSCTLSRREWTHAAHLRMAFLKLQGRTLEEAQPLIRDGIKRYNASLGFPGGYNETLTVAFTHIVAARILRTPCNTYSGFRAANEDLFAAGIGYLGRHYSEPVWETERGRANFIPPDLDSFA